MDNRNSKPNKNQKITQIQENTLRDAKEKQKKGEKLSLFEARALFSEKAQPVKSSRPPRTGDHSKSKYGGNPEVEIQRLHQNIEQIERKIEMDGLSPDQEQKALAQIAKLQGRLDELAGKTASSE